MSLKSFKYWKREEVQDTFGLKRVFKMPLMGNWLDVKQELINETEKQELEQLKEELNIYGSDWNEAALKFFFLGPLMRLVNFHGKVYHPFLEHTLTAYIGKNTTSGKVDFMVAQGEQIPKAPYLCLHEYKPEEGTSNDPYGQLLIAMVAAQQANQKVGLSIPVYGLYNLGSIFYFVLLNDKNYMRSSPYVANEDIFDIFKILRRAKSALSTIDIKKG